MLLEQQGKGIMKETLDSVLLFAQNVLLIRTMSAYVHRENKPSIELLFKSRFRQREHPNAHYPLVYYKANFANEV